MFDTYVCHRQWTFMCLFDTIGIKSFSKKIFFRTILECLPNSTCSTIYLKLRSTIFVANYNCEPHFRAYQFHYYKCYTCLSGFHFPISILHSVFSNVPFSESSTIIDYVSPFVFQICPSLACQSVTRRCQLDAKQPSRAWWTIWQRTRYVHTCLLMNALSFFEPTIAHRSWPRANQDGIHVQEHVLPKVECEDKIW